MKVELIDHMGSDLTVVNAARVSFNKTSDWQLEEGDDPFKYDEVLSEKDGKLISYLAKHEHMSPFGHAFMSFRVKAPIFVARQLVKHKFLRWNEVSRRYVDDEPEFYLPDTWRGKAKDKKQGSEGEVYPSCQGMYTESIYDYLENASVAYKQMLEEGVCEEQARMILPQSLLTEWWWSGSLDAFADMCKLRLSSDTQYETRVIAEMIDREASKLFPVSWEVLTHEGE